MATLKELFAEVDANAQTLKRMVAFDGVYKTDY